MRHGTTGSNWSDAVDRVLPWLVMLGVCGSTACALVAPDPRGHLSSTEERSQGAPLLAHPPAVKESRGPAEVEVQPDPALPQLEAPPPEPLMRDADIPWEANPVMMQLGQIATSMTISEYSHGTSVDVQRGIYRFDCSGMIHWVLRRAAPVAASAASWGLEHRPLAADYQRRIAKIAVGEERFGWLRVERVVDAVPGDVIAWIKPAIIDSPNTGHVAFIALPPVPVPNARDAYLVRVIDSTRLLHDDDTRVGRDGFGMGTILLLTDAETGAPRAYGWQGLKWRAFETQIAIGRPTR